MLLLKYYWNFNTYVCSVLLLRFTIFFPNEVVSIVFFYAVTQCDQEQLKGARGPLGKEAKLGRQG